MKLNEMKNDVPNFKVTESIWAVETILRSRLIEILPTRICFPFGKDDLLQISQQSTLCSFSFFCLSVYISNLKKNTYSIMIPVLFSALLNYLTLYNFM